MGMIPIKKYVSLIYRDFKEFIVFPEFGRGR